MINKRLLNYISPKKDLLKKVIFYRLSILILNILAIVLLSNIFTKIINKENFDFKFIIISFLSISLILIIRVFISIQIPVITDKISKFVKTNMRKEIVDKIFSLRNLDENKFPKGKVLQNVTEGIEQLDVYYSRFIPQLIYSIAAPLVLAFSLSFYSFKIAILMLLLVPLIPFSLMMIGKMAKRISQKYWGEFSDLGSDFLDSIEGLTLLKIYETDFERSKWISERASSFRKITMKMLSMQLNSIWVMDFLAYGGAAIGIYMAFSGYLNQSISISGFTTIVLLSVDYFLPLRLLGSFFHVAINGVSASEFIFEIIDLGEEKITNSFEIKDIKFDVEKLYFSYDDKYVLEDINFEINKGQIIGICGESGSGKSTIAKILNGDILVNEGIVKFGEMDISKIGRDKIKEFITTISFDSFIFKGTLKENLSMGNVKITSSQMWSVLEKVNMKEYFMQENGLETIIDEMGSNLSGGQKQRIAFARALLKQSPVYILDESTSSIDSESEKLIIKNIHNYENKNTIWIIISHRIQNIIGADNIFVFEDGKIIESGNHKQLLENKGAYSKLYNYQKELENYAKGGQDE